jgi:ABC-2 type transport system permease protein
MLANVYTKTIRERFPGIMVAAVSVTVLVAFVAWVYSGVGDAIVQVFEKMPEAFTRALGIPVGASAVVLVMSEMLNLVVPMVLAGMAISMGAAAIAGEERTGTISLLLANPLGRRTVIWSKAAALVTSLVVAGAIVLWGMIATFAVTGNDDLSTLGLLPAIVHVVALAVGIGMFTLAVGAGTGNQVTAVGAGAGLLMGSFLGATLLPLIGGLEWTARLFPWDYMTHGTPLVNGVQWGNLAVLVAFAVAMLVLAGLLITRRDLQAGDGATIVDRLRNNERFGSLVTRIAGQAQVSSVTAKTFSEARTMTSIVVAVIFYLGLLMGPLYRGLGPTLGDVLGDFPEGILAMVGGADFGTAAGWYWGEMFSIVIPVGFAVVAVSMGSRALAGEEHRRTMGLLLANPIRRSRVVLDKAIAMIAVMVVLGGASFVGVALGSLIGRLDISYWNIAGASLQATAFGIFCGGLALAVSAGWGVSRIVTMVSSGVIAFSYVVANFVPINENIAGWAKASPFYYYGSNLPLENGVRWLFVGVLVGLGAALTGLAAALFQRRDLRG